MINSNFRLSGLASGLDTDQMVKDLMKVAKIPLTKLEQKRQVAEWKQESYREFTNSLRSFKEKFFDITKRSSYLLSESTYKAYTTTSSSDEYVTAKGTSAAQSGSHSVKVLQLATADKAVSTSTVSKAITGTVSDFQLAGKTMQVNLDGVTREIALADYTDLADLIGDSENGLQALLDEEFGSGKIVVSSDSGKLQLSTGSGATKLTLSSGSVSDGLGSLGIFSGATNRISTGSKLGSLTDKLSGGLTFQNGSVSFEINGATFSFTENDTLSKVMSTVNNSTAANVTMRYDETSDKFSITAKQTGAGNNIRISQTGGNFFTAIGINPADPVTTQGIDAKAEIDGFLITRSSNTFTANGLEYTLRKQHTGLDEDTITVNQNVDAVYDSIKSFVEDYNKLVDQFTTTLSEKYDRDYLPLSDDDKEAMTEEQIEKWEKQAKSGLLRNDAILSKIQSSMRTALMDSVEGVGISLSSIGITSKSYIDRGKLTIDENKLKEAIRTKPDEVKNLFIQQSEEVPSYTRSLSSTERSTRYKEQGLFFRISDIVDDQISTLRDPSGRKGILLEKAGLVGDATEFNSSMAKSITSYEDSISELIDKLADKEEEYYNQFARLETYMNEMNSQMDWLTSQLNSLNPR